MRPPSPTRSLPLSRCDSSQVQDTALGASLDSLLGALLEGLEAPGEARRAAHLPPLPTLGQWMDTVGAEPRPLAQAREGSNASASAALLRQWGEPVGAEGGHVAVSAHEAGGSGVELYPIPSTLALALYPVSAPAFDIALATAVVGYLFSIYVASRVVAYGRAATL